MNNEKVEPISPAYHFGDPNQSIHLADESVSIVDKGGKVICAGDAEIRLALLPRPRIEAEIKAATHGIRLGEHAVMRLLSRGCSFNGFLSTHIIAKSALWTPQSEPVIAKGTDITQMDRIVFHLFNFRDIIGSASSSVKQNGTFYKIWHIRLNAPEWKCEIRSLPESSSRFHKLRAEGGYGLTHVGHLSRYDGKPLKGKEAADLLFLLHFFLSFLKGGWCEPVCAVGLNSSHEHVWEFWCSPKESFCLPFSWFDEHTCNQAETLFPGFVNRWTDQDWETTLREVIRWYLIANDSSRGADAGIILTQTAIERLSFQFAVNERRLIEADGFDKLRSSDKFRLLLSSLDIPIEIPNLTPELKRIAKKEHWVDAPHALTAVRNRLVHPEKKTWINFILLLMKRGTWGSGFSN